MHSEELYKNPNLKLGDLASRMNMSAHQLSQLLNDNLGKSFSTYINEYRIDEACEKIENGSYFKIEEIGYEVGFNSKSTFSPLSRKLKIQLRFYISSLKPLLIQGFRVQIYNFVLRDFNFKTSFLR